MAMKKAAAKTANDKGKGGKKSRFKGAKVSDRAPQLGPGEYELELVDTGVSYESSEYFKAHATVTQIIDDQRDKGDPGKGDYVLCMLQCMAGKSAKIAIGKVKGLAMAIAGHDDEGEYDEFDPDGLFCEYVLNDGSDGTDADGEPYPELAGTKFRVRVRRGKQAGENDYFRENKFFPAEDE